MILSLPKNDLLAYAKGQLSTLYPDGKNIDVSNRAFDMALERVEYCFQHIRIRGYSKDSQPYFYHLHSDQYSQFLYYLSNSLWTLDENKPVCDKLILLNKALHGCWFSYKAKLPDIFLLAHPLGTVLGNATYSNYLVVYQNVTVNSTEDREKYLLDHQGNMQPVLGKGLFLGAGAKIIGNGKIGDCVSVGVDACIYKREVPSNSLVYKCAGGIKIRPSKRCAAYESFFVDGKDL